MSIAYSSQLVTNGLVFCADPANPNSYTNPSSIMYDLVGNTTGGTISAATYSSLNNGGLVFNGSTASVIFPRTSAYEPATGITLEASFYMTTKNAFNTIMSKPFNGPVWTTPYASYFLRVQAASLQVGFNINGTYTFFDDTFNYLINTFYHVTFTYASGSAKFYRNGVNVTTSAFTNGSITYSTPPLIIGADYGASPLGDWFTGRIYDVKVYNRDLTSSEITQNYNAVRYRFGL